MPGMQKRRGSAGLHYSADAADRGLVRASFPLQASTSDLAGTSVRRIDTLDSVRGLAAITVVLDHILANPIFTATQGGSVIAIALAYSPLHIFWAGAQAVLLFFVLSGFVLALPFLSPSPPSYRAFAVRRVCRIYLPYVFALGVAVVAQRLVFVGPIIDRSAWAIWHTPITLNAAVGYLLMTGLPEHQNFNPVVWSLVHEMRISLVFPILFVITTKLPLIWRCAIFVTLSGACGLAATVISPPRDEFISAVAHSFLRTGYYVWLFILGIELARYRYQIISWLAATRPWMKAALFAIAICLFCIEWLSPVLHYHDELGDFAVGVGAGLFIVLALGSARAFLTGHVPIFLGRISYSVYLLHVIVMETLLYALYDHVSLALILGLILPASILVGYLAYWAVETPSIELGQQLSTLIRRQTRSI